MKSFVLTQRGGSRRVQLDTYDELKDLTMPNTKVVNLNDGVHLLIHNGVTEGSPSEINFIATLLCINGSNCQEIVFGNAIIMNAQIFYHLK